MPPRIGDFQPEIPKNIENPVKKDSEGKTTGLRKVKKHDTKPLIPKGVKNKNSGKQAKSLQDRLISKFKPEEGRSRLNSSDSIDTGYESDESLISSDSFSYGSLERTDSSVSNDSISSAVSDMSEDSEIGAAGHSDTFVKVGDGHIGKLTSKSEADVYARRAELGLDSILPESKPISSLSDDEGQQLSPLLRRAEAEDMSVIVPEMLGKNIPEQQKLEMDIKIGFKTASRQQLKQTGHSSPLKKAAKHKAMDLAYGSASRGYRLEGLKIKGQKPVSNRLKLTKNSKGHIKNVIQQAGAKNKEKILVDLKGMRDALSNSKAAFVASSALFLIDAENPEKTQVKLIDVAHPIEESSKEFTGIRDDNVKALNNLINYIEQIKTP